MGYQLVDLIHITNCWTFWLFFLESFWRSRILKLPFIFAIIYTIELVKLVCYRSYVSVGAISKETFLYTDIWITRSDKKLFQKTTLLNITHEMPCIINDSSFLRDIFSFLVGNIIYLSANFSYYNLMKKARWNVCTILTDQSSSIMR